MNYRIFLEGDDHDVEFRTKDKSILVDNHHLVTEPEARAFWLKRLKDNVLMPVLECWDCQHVFLGKTPCPSCRSTDVLMPPDIQHTAFDILFGSSE